MTVREVASPAERSRVCEAVLRTLAESSGIEGATAAYIRDVAELPTFAVGDEAFLSLKLHFPRAAEVYVMGVRPERHRAGLGRTLLTAGEDYLSGARGPVPPGEDARPLAAGRALHAHLCVYEAVGFAPLEELHGLWGHDPALVLVKRL